MSDSVPTLTIICKNGPYVFGSGLKHAITHNLKPADGIGRVRLLIWKAASLRPCPVVSGKAWASPAVPNAGRAGRLGSLGALWRSSRLRSTVHWELSAVFP